MTADAVHSSPLDREAVLNLVTEQLAEILEKSPTEIAEDAPFADLGADSLALIELVEALEERLAVYVAGFHIDDEDLEGLPRCATRSTTCRPSSRPRSRASSVCRRALDRIGRPRGARPEQRVARGRPDALELRRGERVRVQRAPRVPRRRGRRPGGGRPDRERLPGPGPGEGSLVRSRVVNEAALARAAERLDLATHVRLGKGESRRGPRAPGAAGRRLRGPGRRALPGPGYVAARSFVVDQLRADVAEAARTPKEVDPKARLTQWAQETGRGRPTYYGRRRGTQPLADLHRRRVDRRGRARARRGDAPRRPPRPPPPATR